MKDPLFKTINTVFSVGSIIDIEEIKKAKILMTKEYGNIYTHLPPHLNYTLIPFPGKYLEQGKKVITKYIKDIKPFKVHLSELKYNEIEKFFYVSINSDEIKKHHANITKLLNRYRENYIRAKDMNKYISGKYDLKSIDYLKSYGYVRVMDNFESHITIGNYTIDYVDVPNLQSKLQDILKNTLNKDYLIDNFHASFHTDSEVNQGEIKELWSKVFTLNN